MTELPGITDTPWLKTMDLDWHKIRYQKETPLEGQATTIAAIPLRWVTDIRIEPCCNGSPLAHLTVTAEQKKYNLERVIVRSEDAYRMLDAYTMSGIKRSVKAGHKKPSEGNTTDRRAS